VGPGVTRTPVEGNTLASFLTVLRPGGLRAWTTSDYTVRSPTPVHQVVYVSGGGVFQSSSTNALWGLAAVGR